MSLRDLRELGRSEQGIACKMIKSLLKIISQDQWPLEKVGNASES